MNKINEIPVFQWSLDTGEKFRLNFLFGPFMVDPPKNYAFIQWGGLTLFETFTNHKCMESVYNKIFKNINDNALKALKNRDASIHKKADFKLIDITIPPKDIPQGIIPLFNYRTQTDMDYRTNVLLGEDTKNGQPYFAVLDERDDNYKPKGDNYGLNASEIAAFESGDF